MEIAHRAQQRPNRPYSAADGQSASRTCLDRGVKYLIAAMLVAAAGAVYELFSHGVYSYYMIYAFAVPLAVGALPNLLAERTTVREKRNPDGVESASLSSRLQLAAVATLTTGSSMQGVLEIYGTTNRLMVTYAIVGLILLTAAIITYIVELKAK